MTRTNASVATGAVRRMAPLLILAVELSVGCQASGSAPMPEPGDGDESQEEDVSPVPSDEEGDPAANDDAVESDPEDEEGDGPVDAGTTPADAEPAAPDDPVPVPAPLDCTGREICLKFDDLEAGERPPASLGSLSIAGASKMFVDDAAAYSGTKALRVEGNPTGTTGGTALLSFDVKKLWAKEQRLYVRLMVRPETTAPGDGHWDLIQAHGAVSGAVNYGTMISYGGFGGYKAKLLYVGKPLSWADCSLSAQRFFLPNRWTCLEVMIDKRSEDRAYAVSFNDFPIAELTVGTRPQKSVCVEGFNGIQGHWQVPALDRLAIGYTHYHQQLAPYRFWVDDVVVDSQPIGCPKKP